MSSTRRALLPVVVLLVAACGQTSSPAPSTSGVPAASPTPVASASTAPSAPGSPATGAQELPSAGAALPAGTYTRGAFRPPVMFAVEDGWFVGTASDGFFDVQQERGRTDVIAVQFARPDGIIGAGGTALPASTAATAAQAIHDNPGVRVIDESGSRLGGLEGLILIVENQGSANAPIMDVAPGRLGIDPARRLWIGLFDTADGVLAVMVGGSAAQWDRALTVAEPVLESVVVGGSGTASPAASPSG